MISKSIVDDTQPRREDMRDSVGKKVELGSRKTCNSCFLGQKKPAVKRSIGAVTLDASKTLLIIHDSLLSNGFFYGLFCSVKVAGLAESGLYHPSEGVRLLCNANAIT